MVYLKVCNLINYKPFLCELIFFLSFREFEINIEAQFLGIKAPRDY